MISKRILPLNFILIFATITSLIGIGLSFRYSEKQKTTSFNYSEPQIISENITLVFSDGTREICNLPARIRYSKEITATFNLKDIDNLSQKAINVNVAFLAFDVSIDGKLIYHYSPKSKTVMKGGGFSSHIIMIPKDTEQTAVVTVKYRTLLGDHIQYHINPIRVGYRAFLLMRYFFKDIVLLFISINVILFAFIVLFMSMFRSFPRQLKTKLMYIAFLLFSIAFYPLTQTWTIYYIFPYNTVIYTVEYLTLISLTTMPLLILKNQMPAKTAKLYGFLAALGYTNMIVQTVLTFSGILEFAEMLKVTHFLGIIFAIALLLGVISSYKAREKNTMSSISTVVPLFFFFAVALLDYIFFLQLNYIYMVMISLIIFVFFQYRMIKTELRDTYSAAAKSAYYREIAFIDPLSGCATRVAFEEKISWVKTNTESCRTIGVFSFDLNGLKAANDTYGHTAGDTLIASFGGILRECASTILDSHVFRTGGDEFVVFLVNIDEATMRTFPESVKCKSAVYNGNDPAVPLSYASGCVFGDTNDIIEIDSLIKKADHLMYEDKKSYAYGRRHDDRV